MKKIVIVFGSLFLSVSCFGQGLEVESSISTSSKKEFQNAIGFGMNYQFKPIDSLIQLGFGIHQNYNTSEHTENVHYTSPGPDYFSEITSIVKVTSLRFDLLLVIRENKFDSWTLGADMSYNMLSGNGNEINRYPDSTNTFTENQIFFNYKQYNSIGLALISRFEFKNIFTPNLSLCLNIRPGIIFTGRNDIFDGFIIYPTFLGNPKFLEFQIGLKYNFIRKK